jgi:hypothetical protein
VLLVAAVAVCGRTAQAQSLPPMPHTPELFGIYIGMPANEAKGMLQRRSNRIQVMNMTDPSAGFGLTLPDPKQPDMFEVRLTQLPNEARVWRVKRQQLSMPGAPGAPLLLSVVLGALREKYGKETMTAEHGDLYVYWLYDRSGNLMTRPQPSLDGCDSTLFEQYIFAGPPVAPNEMQKACSASFFAVKAMFNRGPDGTLGTYTVELVSLPYAYQAALNTVAEKRAADKNAQDQRMKGANQNKPTF